ncbi:SDR family oxidoreductase [Cellulomonas sp. DKR-3]|uniref:SDR family oxidoreductase n=1 Tax=Cellulomonas fulva TaxID=2835530 RepID=A0ABS5TXA4_9CELL|nr:SDR family oxidoreductase [Cellulomonas fulva]MBT0993766.1 SDR family oxidoreductase [Cellulomonas fulva]
MTDELLDQRALVIGASRGIGAEIARRVRAAGGEAVVASRHDDADLRLDVLDEASIAAAARSAGTVDHVVSTASAPHDAPVADLDAEGVVTALRAKVVAPLLVAKHFARRLAPGGSMLFFSGVVGWRPQPGKVVTGVANGALAHVVRHLAVELAPVRVNAIAPGIVDSGTWDRWGDAGRAAVLERAARDSLAGRHGTLADVADAVVWLLGAGYVTGEVLHVDGGTRHARP